MAANVKCGIVCEYNPFHNGHAYHIQKTRELTGADIVCVMSGDFVQRAEPAIFDKRLRAEAAIRNGADAVVELPVLYSTATAQWFAYGAIETLAMAERLKYISFGIETAEAEPVSTHGENFAGAGSANDAGGLKKHIEKHVESIAKLIKLIADIQLDESPAFKSKLRSLTGKGFSYPAALSTATVCELEKAGTNIILAGQLLKAPNNVLAVEYLKAIKRKNLKIEPVFIPRSDNGYNSRILAAPFASASAIRRLIADKQPYGDFAPFDFGQSHVDAELFDALARAALLNKDIKDMNCESRGNQSEAAGFDPALIMKLKEGAHLHASLEKIVMHAKSKNCTYSGLKRCIFSIMSDINRSFFEYEGEFFARLLAIKKSFKSSIKDFKDNVIIKAADEKRINSEMAQKIYFLDKAASNLYAVITGQNAHRFYSKLCII